MLAPKGFGLSNFQLKQTHYVLKLKRLLVKAIAGLARSPFVLTEQISSCMYAGMCSIIVLHATYT